VWSLFATQHEAVLHEIRSRCTIMSIYLLWGFNNSGVFQKRSHGEIFR